jgi:hypothetical protein
LHRIGLADKGEAGICLFLIGKQPERRHNLPDPGFFKRFERFGFIIFFYGYLRYIFFGAILSNAIFFVIPRRSPSGKIGIKACPRQSEDTITAVFRVKVL